MKITFTLNGKRMIHECAPFRPLISILRKDLGMTATKEGCGKGECGSCLVLMDEEIVNACLIPAFRLEGAEITTIEKFSQTKEFTALEESVTENHSLQCGFCSAGIMMAAGDLLSHNPNPNNDNIRDALSGNQCRCSGYRAVIQSIHESAGERSKRKYARKK
jgi:aerobic carbon-monoxide dehydrogenase small subunit